MSPILTVAVILVGALGVLNLLLSLAIVRKLRGSAPASEPPAVSGLARGGTLPDFEATARDGAAATSAMFADGGLLIFLRARCPFCWEKLSAMGAYVHSTGFAPDRVLFVVIEDGEVSAEHWQELGSLGVVVAENPGGALSERFQIRATPAYGFIGPGALIGPWSTDPAELPQVERAGTRG
ncbi:redoxin domain-containing protein [Actinospica robiniae]|uniref:redoxin domain-containing protein n=1 Tax=Actinospica robiniae TaxID=304901 RepID=UPI0004093A1F|nr:redoxin domain-containing protein [Actinospica robiniae]